jgi:hypothetical protein
VQVDKTLAMTGRQPSEVERLCRLILGSYGRLEALFVGLTTSEAERRLADGRSATSILRVTIEDAAATTTDVRAAI